MTAFPSDTSTGPDTVLLTGIGGFVAGHVAVQLLQQGWRVRGTARSLNDAPALRALLCKAAGRDPAMLEIVAADLMSDTGWDVAARGCRYVIHTASPFPDKLPEREEDLTVPATEGTLRVLAAARRAGVRRVVVTSSLAAVCYGRDPGAPYTEADWSDPDDPQLPPYYKSKTLAERAAWRYAREHGLELATVNPGIILGPVLSARTGTSVDVVRKLLAGAYPAMPDIGFAVVDVRDVADLHLRAMTGEQAAGRRFIAAGRFMRLADMAQALREAMPQYAGKLPRRVMPHWLTRLLARFMSDARSVLVDLGMERTVSHEQARRLLGWVPRGEAATVRDTADSLRGFGLV